MNLMMMMINMMTPHRHSNGGRIPGGEQALPR